MQTKLLLNSVLYLFLTCIAAKETDCDWNITPVNKVFVTLVSKLNYLWSFLTSSSVSLHIIL